jgi:hypothetical protein
MDEEAAADLTKSCLERNMAAPRIVSHDLKPGYFRLAYHSIQQLRAVLQNLAVEHHYTDENIDYVLGLAREKGHLETREEALVPKLEEAISSNAFLSKVRTWWDQIPDYPSITSAGVAVAYANSRRYHDFADIRGLAEYLEKLS